MTMHETLAIALAWIAGGSLGVFFFGGLWWTVSTRLASTKPALWVFGSLLLRMGVTMTGFYFVSGGEWQRLLSCLIGFIMARHLVTRLTRTAGENKSSHAQEASHAP